MEECIHGMESAWCALCLEKTRPKPSPTWDTVTSTIPAKYDGWCKACGDRIEQGDSIVFSEQDDGYVHGDC